MIRVRGASDGSRLERYETLPSEYPSLFQGRVCMRHSSVLFVVSLRVSAPYCPFFIFDFCFSLFLFLCSRWSFVDV